MSQPAICFLPSFRKGGISADWLIMRNSLHFFARLFARYFGKTNIFVADKKNRVKEEIK
jgi:hypothetical protein